MQMKPPAHSLKLGVMPPSEKVVFPPGTKKAQVPPHTLARSSGVVGAALTVKAVVAAFGVLTAVTVGPGASTPVPDFTVISIGGVVTAGWLDPNGRYSVVPGVPAFNVLADA